MTHRRHHKTVFTRNGLLYSLVLCVLILVFGGLGFWVLEPSADRFGDALWLAFTTAATVGYGDIVPSTTASRLFAVVVVLLGLAVLSLVTASVAAVFVRTEERQIESDLMREIARLHTEMQQLRHDVSSRLDRVQAPAPAGTDEVAD